MVETGKIYITDADEVEFLESFDIGLDVGDE